MLAPGTLMEIEAFGAVLQGDAFHLVSCRVGMHEIHENTDSQLVGPIDERFELVGCAEP